MIDDNNPTRQNRRLFLNREFNFVGIGAVALQDPSLVCAVYLFTEDIIQKNPWENLWVISRTMITKVYFCIVWTSINMLNNWGKIYIKELMKNLCTIISWSKFYFYILKVYSKTWLILILLQTLPNSSPKISQLIRKYHSKLLPKQTNTSKNWSSTTSKLDNFLMNYWRKKIVLT